ncbi:MAG: hypothetical protein LUM44_15855 [Pyrinomonadaceae bacterium]|nr:hypothetical protein [Pyrinomonadaceae bacterium]
MRAHLNHIEILKYRQATLPPLELLEVDCHLENCDQCRMKLRQNQELAILYNSFFEPLNGATEEENSRLLKIRFKERWRQLKSLHFFPVGTLLTNWRRQTALAGLVFLIASGFLIFSLTKNETNEVAGNIVPTQENKTAGENQIITPTTVEPVETVEPPKIYSKSVKAAPTDKDLIAKKTSPTAKKPEPDLVVKVDSLETDRSNTLSNDANPKEAVNAPFKVEIKPLKKGLSIDFSDIEKADEYEIYIAEMPDFITVSREKTKRSRSSISLNKLAKGKDYVLQITALNQGMPIQSVKRKLNLKTAPN